MEPLHFGIAVKPLFGTYHPPGTAYSTQGCIFCNALGQEAIRLFRCYRDSAAALSQSGIHCLRFDYRGSGDSFGDESDYSIEGWLEDIELAIVELKDIAGVEQVVLVGARLGASLAILSSARSADARRVVALDPVLDGQAYIRRLTETQADLCRDPDRFRLPRDPAESPEDLLGFPLNTAFREELSRMKLYDVLSDSGPRVSLILTQSDGYSTQATAASGEIAEHWFAADKLSVNPKWHDASHIEQTLLSPEVVSAISESARK